MPLAASLARDLLNENQLGTQKGNPNNTTQWCQQTEINQNPKPRAILLAELGTSRPPCYKCLVLFSLWVGNLTNSMTKLTYSNINLTYSNINLTKADIQQHQSDNAISYRIYLVTCVLTYSGGNPTTQYTIAYIHNI